MENVRLARAWEGGETLRQRDRDDRSPKEFLTRFLIHYLIDFVFWGADSTLLVCTSGSTRVTNRGVLSANSHGREETSRHPASTFYFDFCCLMVWSCAAMSCTRHSRWFCEEVLKTAVEGIDSNLHRTRLVSLS